MRLRRLLIDLSDLKRPDFEDAQSSCRRCKSPQASDIHDMVDLVARGGLYKLSGTVRFAGLLFGFAARTSECDHGSEATSTKEIRRSS